MNMSIRRIEQAVNILRSTRELAKRQIMLSACPCCAAEGAELLFDICKHPGSRFVSSALNKGGYSLCHRCGVVFAAARPTAEMAQTYYDLLFKEGRIEQIPVAAIPRGVDKHVLKLLQDRRLVRPGMAVLHLRCDTGALLQALREQIPDAAVYGLEYFDHYVHFLRSQGIGATKLNPAKIDLPHGAKYDLILANHQLTHAIDPRGLIADLTDALREHGHILFYNEIDHDVELDPASGLNRNTDIVGFHKQLFNRPTFEWLLSASGLEYEWLGHLGAKMMYLTRPSGTNVRLVPAASDLIEHQRRLFLAYDLRMQIHRSRRRKRKILKPLRFLAQLPQAAIGRVLTLAK